MPHVTSLRLDKVFIQSKQPSCVASLSTSPPPPLLHRSVFKRTLPLPFFSFLISRTRKLHLCTSKLRPKTHSGAVFSSTHHTLLFPLNDWLVCDRAFVFLFDLRYNFCLCLCLSFLRFLAHSPPPKACQWPTRGLLEHVICLKHSKNAPTKSVPDSLFPLNSRSRDDNFSHYPSNDLL